MSSLQNLPGSGSTYVNPVQTIATGDPSRPTDQREEVETLSALIELIGAANAANGFSEASASIIDQMRPWTDADAIELFWQRRPGAACELIAACGREQRESALTPALRQAAANEVVVRGAIADTAALAPRERVALLAIKEYASVARAKRVFGVPLGSAEDDIFAREPIGRARVGALLLRFDRPVSENAAKLLRRRLDVCRGPLGQTLSRIESTEPSWISRLCDFRTLINGRHRRLLFVGLLILSGILLVPLHYRPSVQCELQPIARRYVASPAAGPLLAVNVRPGDEVHSGDLLARIDPRETEMELAGKRAEIQRAQQEQKGQLAQHEFAESKMSALRVERLQSEADILRHRRKSLDIHAPIDGMVVAGDWKRSEGTPLERGETLFEIAPLGDFLVEVAVDESDLLCLREGMQLRFRLDALPSRVFTATLQSIHPRAEVRDDSSVFIAEAAFKDSERILRPGMKGRGNVTTDRRPLVWNLFHKAYHRAIASLGG